MNFFKTLLQWIKKRWYFLLILFLIAAVGGGTVAKFYFEPHFKAIRASRTGQQAYQQLCIDLINLERYPGLEVNPGQAKVMLPLIEKMANSTDPALQVDMAGKIYGMLTPAQYAMLLDNNKYLTGNTGNENIAPVNQGKDYHEKRKNNFREYKGFGLKVDNPMLQALGSVTTKMLAGRSQEKTPSNQ